MKKYSSMFLFLIILLATLGMVAPVYAEENKVPVSGMIREDGLQKIKYTREELKKQRETLLAEIEQKREAVKTRLQALKEGLKNEKDKLKAKIKEERITGRQRALEVFDKITNKINSFKNEVNAHITKLEAKGVDTTKAKDLLAQVETKLNEVKSKITEINTIFAASTEKLSLEDKAKVEKLRQEIQALLKESHALLKEAVKSLKDSILEKRLPPEIDTRELEKERSN